MNPSSHRVSAEQSELRSLAGQLEVGCVRSVDYTVGLLRRAADRLDRLTALVAEREEHGDAL